MNVVSQRGLTQLLKGKAADVAEEVTKWYRVARRSQWASLADVCQQFPSADQVGDALIFNIRHNRYRLIVNVVYPAQKIFVKALLTHKEYNREEWKRWV